jgi:hypothetical protein
MAYCLAIAFAPVMYMCIHSGLHVSDLLCGASVTPSFTLLLHFLSQMAMWIITATVATVQL